VLNIKEGHAEMADCKSGRYNFQHILCCFFLQFRICTFHNNIPQTHLNPSTAERAERRRSDTAAAERAVRTCFIMVRRSMFVIWRSAVWRSDVSRRTKARHLTKLERKQVEAKEPRHIAIAAIVSRVVIPLPSVSGCLCLTEYSDLLGPRSERAISQKQK